jgi:hypothetical protein
MKTLCHVDGIPIDSYRVPCKNKSISVTTRATCWVPIEPPGHSNDSLTSPTSLQFIYLHTHGEVIIKKKIIPAVAAAPNEKMGTVDILIHMQ